MGSRDSGTGTEYGNIFSAGSFLYAFTAGKKVSKLRQIYDRINLYLYDYGCGGQSAWKNCSGICVLTSSLETEVIYINKAGGSMKERLSWEKLKGMGADKLVICLLIGVFLLVICIPTGSKKESGREGIKEETQVTAEIDPLEERLKGMLEQIQGVGKVEVMITVTGDGTQVEGVAVVAQGADTPQVRQEIMETAQALFPIAAHKIKVCKMTE